MPLITLHTRLIGLLAEARYLRQASYEAITAMESGAVSANAVVGLTQRFQATIANVITPVENDTDLVAYAAEQFSGQNWIPLDQQIAGVKLLINAVIVAARATIPIQDGYLLKDIWNEDGSVSVRQLQIEDTANLRTALTNLSNAIPE